VLCFAETTKAQDWSRVDFYSKKGNHQLSDYRGKIVLVMFWATWCPYCKNQLPALSMLKGLYNNIKDLEVLAISIDRGDSEKVSNYLETYQIDNLGTYIDANSNLMNSMGFSAVPTLLLISADGNILGSYRGLQDLDVKYLDKLIAENEQKNQNI